MKYILFILSIFALSAYAYADIVNVISVSTDHIPTPKYFLMSEDASFEIDETTFIVKTENVRLEFPLEDNPEVKFTQQDHTLVEGYVGIDKVYLQSSDTEIFTIEGNKVSGENLSSGSYIVRSGKQSYKIIIK